MDEYLLLVDYLEDLVSKLEIFSSLVTFWFSCSGCLSERVLLPRWRLFLCHSHNFSGCGQKMRQM
jgi:hypothetical protein